MLRVPSLGEVHLVAPRRRAFSVGAPFQLFEGPSFLSHLYLTHQNGKTGEVMAPLFSSGPSGLLCGGSLPVDHHSCGYKTGLILMLLGKALGMGFCQRPGDPRGIRSRWFGCYYQGVGIISFYSGSYCCKMPGITVTEL